MKSTAEEIKSRIVEERRPWGGFRRFISNEPCTVKILTVNPGQILSRQTHSRRDELWVILDDGLRTEVAGDVREHQAGDEVVIPRNAEHRLSSVGGRGRVLEISFGQFDEDDITRSDDAYGHA